MLNITWCVNRRNSCLQFAKARCKFLLVLIFTIGVQKKNFATQTDILTSFRLCKVRFANVCSDVKETKIGITDTASFVILCTKTAAVKVLLLVLMLLYFLIVVGGGGGWWQCCCCSFSCKCSCYCFPMIGDIGFLICNKLKIKLETFS